jgi:two-component system, NtrC family, response regulator AtoC
MDRHTAPDRCQMTDRIQHSVLAGTGRSLQQFMSETGLRVRALSVERFGQNRAVEMVGLSPCFLQLQQKLCKIARYREPVLITGDSGVGKEQLAQALFLLGQPDGGPYISVNCPQYEDGNVTVSELFGHTKGSFTGAVSDRKGAFEEADGGVIFLDEIGDLHPGAQAMLLRTLSTGEFKPLGATHPRTASVRVVAATNRPLNKLVLDEKFRYDLFFRLRHFHLPVPPLRERGDDWLLVLEHSLLRLQAKYGLAKRFSPASMRLLEKCSWPGNIRQLVSVVSMGYAMADGELIEPDDCGTLLEEGQKTSDTSDRLFDTIVRDGSDFWQVIYQPFMERELNRSQVKTVMKRGLRAADGNYRRLIEMLRLPSTDYQRFMDFLRHHDLKP